MTKKASNMAFAEAMAECGADLDDEMRSWNLEQTLEGLRAAARLMKSATGHNLRKFAPRHLGLAGEKNYTKLVGWCKNPKLMSADDIKLVLTSLKKFRDVHLDAINANEKALAESVAHRTNLIIQSSRNRAIARAAGKPLQKKPQSKPSPIASEVNQKIVSHTLTIMSSLTIMMAAAKLSPEHAYDRDRMLIREKLQKICGHLGIEAAFKEIKPAHSESTAGGSAKAPSKGGK